MRLLPRVKRRGSKVGPVLPSSITRPGRVVERVPTGQEEGEKNSRSIEWSKARGREGGTGSNGGSYHHDRVEAHAALAYKDGLESAWYWNVEEKDRRGKGEVKKYMVGRDPLGSKDTHARIGEKKTKGMRCRITGAGQQGRGGGKGERAKRIKTRGTHVIIKRPLNLN